MDWIRVIEETLRERKLKREREGEREGERREVEGGRCRENGEFLGGGLKDGIRAEEI